MYYTYIHLFSLNNLCYYIYIFFCIIVYIQVYVTIIFMFFSSGVYLYFRIFMYVKRHEQFEIGCGTILNKILLLLLLRLSCIREFLKGVERKNLCQNVEFF